MELIATAAAPNPVPRLAPPLTRPGRRPQFSTPELSFVIVNHRQWGATARLVKQLRQSVAMRRGLAEIVIVDNHSPAHPLAARLRRLSAVSLRRWGRNRGFARGVNEGCRLSRGRWFMLLNPDMTAPPGFVDNLLALARKYAADHPRAGIIGLRLLNEDGTIQGSTGPFPSLAGTLARLALPRTRRKYSVSDGADIHSVSWVTGCCLLMRQDCYRDLGGLDEDYFLYYEDVDLCLRAQERGWSVWHDPRLQVIHHRPLHQRTVPAHLRLFTRHALLTYGAKHWPGWQARLLARVVKVEAWMRKMLAKRRGQGEAADLFGRLGDVARDLASERRARARKRLDRVVRLREKQGGR
ncbi:MAG: glycosyltransferase family 2 protein [Gemmataceae bacterium]